MYLNRSVFLFAISLLVVVTEFIFLAGSAQAVPQAINEVTSSYNTITLTHQYDHQEDVPVTCNGSEEQPLRFNVLTGEHNTTIFRPEGTVCNLQIGGPANPGSGGLNLGSTMIAETKVSPTRPARSTTYFVSPDGIGVSQSLLAPGSLSETLTSNLEDAEIFFFPGLYKDVGEIRANNLSGVSLIGNGAIIDGSGRRLGDAISNTWVPIGNGVWENTNPEVVDPKYLMMLFDDKGWGTGIVIQHAGTSANRQEVYGIDFDCYWSTSPDKRTWWIRLENDESPAEHQMVRFSKEFGIRFQDANDLWVEDLQLQNFGKFTSEGETLFPNRNRILSAVNSSNITFKDVLTRHSTSSALFLLDCSDILLDGCQTEHRRFQTHNRDTLKPSGPVENLSRYGWENASSFSIFDCQKIVSRNCEVYGVTDWCHLHDSSYVDIHDNVFERVVGESMAASGDCRNVRFWNNRIYNIEIQGPFTMQASTGPVWYVNNASIDSGGWTPKDDLTGVIPSDETLPNNFRFLGWEGSNCKFNTTHLPLIGQVMFFNNTGVLDHSFEERYIWDARQSAFSLGGQHQIHSETISRNNVWSSSGICFSGGHPLDNLDFDYDQLWADDLQDLGWKYLYPHGSHLSDPNDATHETLEAFREASGTYPNSGVEQKPVLDILNGNPFNVANRAPGTFLPGITDNSLFGNPQAQTGAYLPGERNPSFLLSEEGLTDF